MSLIRGKIIDLAYGGKGVMKNPDQPVVFIPFTAPGEDVECEVIQVKKNYFEALPRKIFKPSSERVTPPCPYFGTCGGCQLQHLNYETQIQHKQKVVQNFIQRIYPNVNVSISRASPIWAYRRHVTLTIRQGQLGYYALDNLTLIEVEECPIFTSQKNPIFNLIRRLVSSFSEGKVKILKTVANEYILSFHFKEVPRNFWALAEEIFFDPIIGIRANSIKKGVTETKVTVDGIEFVVDPSIFIQVHPEQSEQIYKEIKKYFMKIPARILLDLYCGIGISSVLVAPYARQIFGVEMDRRAIEIARTKKFSHIHFQAKDVRAALSLLLSKHPDAAIINPPREGIDRKVAEKISISRLERIVYVSCQPATLMRDLQIFNEQKFKLVNVQAFDMFPQTGHVETLAILER